MKKEVKVVLRENWSHLPDLHELKSMQHYAVLDDASNPISEALTPQFNFSNTIEVYYRAQKFENLSSKFQAYQ